MHLLRSGSPHGCPEVEGTGSGPLAGTYSDLGRLKDALEHHEQTLSMHRNVLGSEHPDTIDSFEWVDALRGRMAGEKPALKQGKLGKLKRVVKFF